MDNAKTFPAEAPFLKEIGVESMEMANGEAQLTLVLERRHLNSWQMAHGGLTMTLLDVVMSAAGRSLHPQAQAGVTVEMKTSFVQAGGAEGSRLVVKGKVFHRSTTMCFCEAEAWNDGRLVAKAMGTFKYLKRLDAVKKIRAAGASA